MVDINNIIANCSDCQDDPNHGYHCAPCGEHCESYQCHYWGDGKGGFEFQCDKGRENTALKNKGLSPRWEYGVEISG